MINTVEYLVNTIGLPKEVEKVVDISKVFDVEMLFSDGSYEAGIRRASCIRNAIDGGIAGKIKVGRLAISPITNRIDKSGKNTFVLIDATRIRTD